MLSHNSLGRNPDFSGLRHSKTPISSRKPKILLTLLFVVLVQFSFGQTKTYHPFPDSNAVWRIDYINYGDQDYKYYQYKILGDTIIGENTYRKIYETGSNNWINIWENVYKGAYREDISTKKIYFISEQSISEILLYDFSLNVGDTIKSRYIFSCCDSFSIIYSIDSILIGNEYRRKLNLMDTMGNTYPHVSLIEGIGSTAGLLECGSCFEIEYNLVCFKQNNITLYPDTSYDCSEIIAGTKKPKNNFKQDFIEINPIPFSNYLYIKTHNNVYGKITIDIYTLLGKNIYSQKLNCSNYITINLNFLSKGIYFIKIITNNQQYNSKIIKL